MQEQEIELTIGDSIMIGNQIVTIVDIEAGIVSFRIDDEDFQEISIGGFHQTASP